MFKYYRYIGLFTLRGMALILKFSLSIFIARFIGLEALGMYGLVIGLTLFLPSLLKFGIFLNLSREFISLKSSVVFKQLSTYFMFTTLTYVLIAPIIFILFKYFDFNKIFSFNWLYLILLIYFEHLIIDVVSVFNSVGLILRANLTSLLQAVLNVSPIFLLYLLTDRQLVFEDVIKCWLAGNLLTFVFILLMWGRGFFKLSYLSFDANWYLSKLKASVYLYFNELVSVTYSVADRYLITYFMSMQFVGIYTFYLQLINAVYTLINSSVIQGHRTQILHFTHKQEYGKVKNILARMTWESVIILAILSAIIAIFMPLLARIVNKYEVVEYIEIFYLLALVFIVRVIYTAYSIVLYAQKEDLFLFKNLLLCVVLNLIFAFELSRVNNLYAVPLALLISFLIGLLSCILVYKRVGK